MLYALLAWILAKADDKELVNHGCHSSA